MAYSMHYTELIEKLKHYAVLPNYYDNQTEDWLTWNPKKNAWPADCIRGPKGLIYWDWKEDKNAAHGGAVYKRAYDYTEIQWINHCNNVSSKFNLMKPGELLYMPGHCGIYMGNWTVFEITVAWGVNGAVLSDIDNTGRRTLNGVPAQNAYWQLHGEIPEIDYREKNVTVISEEGFDLEKIWTIKKGSVGGHVRTLQAILNAKNNAGLIVDGVCGPITEAAIYSWQMKFGLYQDGICGPITWFDIVTRDV